MIDTDTAARQAELADVTEPPPQHQLSAIEPIEDTFSPPEIIMSSIQLRSPTVNTLRKITASHIYIK